MYYKRNESLEKILSGKTVILVGPSPYLSGKENGKLIDQYDIICRMNEVFPVGQANDYGSRTDIAFLNKIYSYLIKYDPNRD
mgnify:CR=1 FL=1